MNASFNASNIDVYLNAVGTNIATAGVNPAIAATAYKTSGPATGNDSLSIDAGTYQMVVTTAATKVILFASTIVVEKNKDILLLTVPSTVAPGSIKTLIKVEGTAGSTELLAS